MAAKAIDLNAVLCPASQMKDFIICVIGQHEPLSSPFYEPVKVAYRVPVVSRAATFEKEIKQILSRNAFLAAFLHVFWKSFECVEVKHRIVEHFLSYFGACRYEQVTFFLSKIRLLSGPGSGQASLRPRLSAGDRPALAIFENLDQLESISSWKGKLRSQIQRR